MTAAGGQADIVKNDYSYYDDGSPKYLHNWLDERFDRGYGYDHRGMLQQAFSSSEARDFVNNTTTQGATGPCWQIYQHDAFGNMTQRDNRFWSQSDVYDANYFNNRRTDAGFQYDADGKLPHDADLAYGYDAAGNNASLTDAANGIAYATSFDGDGQMAKKVQTSWGTTIAVTYYIRSTVLGGRVITEIGGMTQNLGQKVIGYVMYIASDLYGMISTDEKVRTYFHELGNILAASITGDIKGGQYGNPNGIGNAKDPDTGARLEKCIFGSVPF